jgi:very-short-patch-repair endonuclease
MRRKSEAGSSLERELALKIKLARLPEPQREHRFEEHRGPQGRLAHYRFDFAWPEKKLAVECEGGIWRGGRHVTGAGFEKDARKYNRAVLLGWRVLRFTASMISSGEAIRSISESLDQA